MLGIETVSIEKREKNKNKNKKPQTKQFGLVFIDTILKQFGHNLLKVCFTL